MEFRVKATEKQQRGWHRLPGSVPGRRRGKTHSSRASPGVRLRSWLAAAQAQGWEGGDFLRLPPPRAGWLGTCRANLVRGGAEDHPEKEQELQGSRGTSLARDGTRKAASPAWDASGKEVSCGSWERVEGVPACGQGG